MPTRAEELRNPNSCFNKARDDEPLFVLRAQDETTIHVINIWIAIGEALGISKEKVAQAIHARNAIMVWQGVNHTLVKKPD